MAVAEIIRSKLTARFAPTRLEIIDESARHAGDAGARPEGESHFRIAITAAAFSGLPRLARQRLVYETLAEELETRVHALSLEARAGRARAPRAPTFTTLSRISAPFSPSPPKRQSR